MALHWRIAAHPYFENFRPPGCREAGSAEGWQLQQVVLWNLLDRLPRFSPRS
jgi:hypothetical protein